MAKISVKDTELTIVTINDADYICITDLARYKNPEHSDDVVKNWLRNRNTIELLGIWETLHNPNFKPVEFDGFRKEAGMNSFVMTPKRWIENTNAIGLISKSGRYGGTYAHRDIALEFASWISIEFKLYLLMEFQRLKEEENKQLGWSAKREHCLNYDFHKIFVISLITKILSIIKILKIKVQTGYIPQSDRLVKLNQIAIQQMQVLQDVENRKMLI
jgi:hypothetical protein